MRETTEMKSLIEQWQELFQCHSADNLIIGLATGGFCHINMDTLLGLPSPRWNSPDYNETRVAYNEAQRKFFEEIDYEYLDGDGGGEGGTEYVYGVFRLQGKIYKADWRYDSHHGYDYNDIARTVKEVKPVQKTITVYE